MCIAGIMRRLAGGRVLVGCLAMALFSVSGMAPAESAQSPCTVLVGPTSDETLTRANLAWTRQLIKKVNAAGLACDLQFVQAWARANSLFAQGRADVLFPEIIGDPNQPGITGRPLAETEGFVVVTPADAPVIHEPTALVGRRVGIIRGRFYAPALMTQEGIQLEEAGSLEQNITKLLHGRLDATVEYQGDILKLLQDETLANRIHYGQPFGASSLAYRFADTEKGRALRQQFDQAITELMADGSYKQIFQATNLKLLGSQ
jgi:ABC-type amino acid transport substrate-binding protein